MNVQLSNHYSSYLEQFARSHPDIQHQDVNGKRAFFSIHLEQIFNKFQSIREKGYALYAIKYIWSIREGRVHYSAGFIIIGYAPADNYAKVKATESKTEYIAKQLIAKIRQDSQAGEALFQHSLDELENVTAEPYTYRADPNYVGWFVTFDFHQGFSLCVPADFGLKTSNILLEAAHNQIQVRLSASPLSTQYYNAINNEFLNKEQTLSLKTNSLNHEIDSYNLPTPSHPDLPSLKVEVLDADYIDNITIEWL